MTATATIPIMVLPVLTNLSLPESIIGPAKANPIKPKNNSSLPINTPRAYLQVTIINNIRIAVYSNIVNIPAQPLG